MRGSAHGSKRQCAPVVMALAAASRAAVARRAGVRPSWSRPLGGRAAGREACVVLDGGYSRGVNRAEKARRILRILDDLYPAPPVPLAHADPFTLLVAVVLSAQTTDARVNQVTPALFAAAPTPAAMAALGERRILRHIASCGLAPTKAKNLAALSRILADRHGGEVPGDFEALVALPGVGRKSANVVLAQAFGVPTMPVDTHIHRLAARFGLSDGSSVLRTETDLCRVFPREAWIRVHLQLIHFGREHCPALRHDFRRCPICSWAASRRKRVAEVGNGGRRGSARR